MTICRGPMVDSKAQKKAANLHLEAGHLFRSILDFRQDGHHTSSHFVMVAIMSPKITVKNRVLSTAHGVRFFRFGLRPFSAALVLPSGVVGPVDSSPWSGQRALV